jgi:hypothetical protein
MQNIKAVLRFENFCESSSYAQYACEWVGGVAVGEHLHGMRVDNLLYNA